MLIFDCSSSWVSSGSPALLQEVLTAVRVFVSTILCTNRSNRIAVVTAQGKHSRHVYLEPELDEGRSDGNTVAENVERALRDAIVNPDLLTPHAGVAGALGLALCYSNKLRSTKKHLAESRFVVVSKSPGLLVVGFFFLF